MLRDNRGYARRPAFDPLLHDGRGAPEDSPGPVRRGAEAAGRHREGYQGGRPRHDECRRRAQEAREFGALSRAGPPPRDACAWAKSRCFFDRIVGWGEGPEDRQTATSAPPPRPPPPPSAGPQKCSPPPSTCRTAPYPNSGAPPTKSSPACAFDRAIILPEIRQEVAHRLVSAKCGLASTGFGRSTRLRPSPTKIGQPRPNSRELVQCWPRCRPNVV